MSVAMASVGETPRPNHHFATHRLPLGHAADMSTFNSSSKIAPRLKSPSSPDAMDISRPYSSISRPHSDKDPKSADITPDGGDPEESSDQNLNMDTAENNSNNQIAIPSAANNTGPAGPGAQQGPKVVQTAFIHKLYSMLEDQTIKHLISWSSSGESFVMAPSTEFSKVLASYFKHTNISSFVRQLNMYGFHKVSDVFHPGSPDSPLWEFKHGGGSFKKGDLVGLRDIKRRASRHTLMHRESFSGPPARPHPFQQPSGSIAVGHSQIQASAPPSAPPPSIHTTTVSTPHPPPHHVHTGPPDFIFHDHAADRVGGVEHSYHEIYSRLARTEELFTRLNTRCNILTEGLAKCHQWSGDLAAQLLNVVPDTENPVHKEASALRAEISHHMEALRTIANSEVSRDAPPRQRMSISRDPLATSPRLYAIDSHRQPSLHVPGVPATFKSPLPPPLNTSPQRAGGLSASDERISPSSGRLQAAAHINLPAPHQATGGPSQHLAAPTSPTMNLGRRHTSAEINLQGWQGGTGTNHLHNNGSSPPHAAGSASGNWPSSPFRQPSLQGDQHIRDTLAQYQLSKPASVSVRARQSTPPPDGHAPIYAATGNDAGMLLSGPKFSFKNVDSSAPATRRSSMASNVHSLLNPAQTADREGDDGEDRKRKRLA